MPTYEYDCWGCGRRFERRQSITEEPLRSCPECGGEVHRLVSGGAGFIVRGEGRSGGGGCSLEERGKTCCGRKERCDVPGCAGAR